MAIPTIRRNFPSPFMPYRLRRGRNRIRGTANPVIDIRLADLCFRNQRSARPPMTIYRGNIYRFPDPELYAQGGRLLIFEPMLLLLRIFTEFSLASCPPSEPSH